ncbi:MAG: hypothetical protein QUV05_05815 [Phycisphaerae bacterium]|nr:hypothetical protein [Phycisphaerae bacterium]
MRTVETTAKTGPDGVLRLELPTGQPDQTVHVVVTLQPISETDQQARLLKAGIRPPVRWNEEQIRPLNLGDPPVSQTLIEDRR